MPAISTLPGAINTPGVYNAIDNSGAVRGPVANSKRALLVGIRLAAGSVGEGVETLIAGELSADPLFGAGSQLAEMCRAFKRANPLTELYAIGVDQPVGGTAASGSIAFAGTATEGGTYAAYVDGVRVEVAVATGDTASDVGAAFEAAAASNARLPVTGSNSAGTVTVTSKWSGTTGNAIQIEEGLRASDATPAGITTTITAMASGAGAADMATAIAAMGDKQYGHIGWGVLADDDTSMDLIDAEMDRRWGPTVGEIKGHSFVALRGTLSEVTTATASPARNNPYVTVIDANRSHTAEWIWAANLAAVDAREADPTLTRRTLVLSEVTAGPESTYRTLSDSESLLGNGCATHKPDASGNVAIERLVTTYQVNSGGSPDPSYRDRETLGGLQYFAETWKNRAAQKFARVKLVNVGTNVAPGVAAVDTNDIRAELIGWYEQMIAEGHGEDLAGFKESAIVERDASDANRVNVYIAPDVANNLLILGTLLGFRL